MNSPTTGDDGIEETADWNWKMITIGVIALLVLVFILQNTEKQSIQFLLFDWTVGTWLALLITFVLGMLVGWLLTRVMRSRKDRATDRK